MKKILSVVLAVMMLATMMITVSAANKDAAITFVPSTTDIKVGDTFTVAMNITGDTDSTVVCLGGSFQLTASSNVTVDGIVAGAEAADFATQNIYTDFATKKQNINDSTGFGGNGDLLVITFTAKEAGDFSLSAASTKVQFKTIGTTSKYNVTSVPELKLTIKAAKEETVNTIAATEDVEIGGNKYMGTAVYEASFNLESVVDTTKDYGITVNGENFLINMGGEGTVNYVLAYYNVTTAPTVTTFWTAQ